MALRELLLLIHLLAAAMWVGGMATMTFAVRPALPLIDAPPQRVRFVAAVFARLFAAVAVSIVLLFASGLAIVMGAGGLGRVHWSVHAMLAVALVMAAIFGLIRFGPFARLRRAIEAQQWPLGAAQIASIRRLIGINLALGVLVFALATLGRAF
jgi:uncharacterized membrane protein